MGNNILTEFARAIVRPAITIMFGAVIVDMVRNGLTPPTWFLSLAIPIIVEWFGERLVRHIKERKNGWV